MADDTVGDPTDDAVGTPDLGTEGAEDLSTPEGTDPAADTTPPEPTPKVTVVIDGKDVEVDYDEVVKGYQRQADYTRKTQALSQREQELAQAQQLWEAFQNDPNKTLQVLSQYYGTEGGEDGEGTDPDPTEQRLAQLEAQQQAQAQAELEVRINGELQEIADEFQVELDFTELLEFAVKNDVPNLRAAFLLQRDEQARAAKRDERNRAAVEAKRKAAPVAGGSRATGGVQAQAKPAQSIAEAWAAAKSEFDID